MHIRPSSPTSVDITLQPEESAAIKIQAGYRGYRVRKQLHHRQNENRNRIQHLNRRNLRQQTQQSIPNSNRYDLQILSYPEITMSNTTAQIAANRINSNACNASNTNSTSVEDRCATKIQAGVRGFLVRKKQQKASDAATKIQASFRGFKARKEAQRLKQK